MYPSSSFNNYSPILIHAHPQLLNSFNANPIILLFYPGKNNNNHNNKILRKTGNTNLHSQMSTIGWSWVLEAFFRWVMHSQFTISPTPLGIWIYDWFKNAKKAIYVTLIVFWVHKPVRQELFLSILSHPSKWYPASRLNASGWEATLNFCTLSYQLSSRLLASVL